MLDPTSGRGGVHVRVIVPVDPVMLRDRHRARPRGCEQAGGVLYRRAPPEERPSGARSWRSAQGDPTYPHDQPRPPSSMPSVVIGRLRAIDGQMIVIGRQRIRVPTRLQTELTLGASYRVVASRTPDGALLAESITRNEDDPLPPQA
jgi:hypothetical protein